MFLEIITLLVLIAVIVSYVLLHRLIVRNFKKSREFNKIQYVQLINNSQDLVSNLLDTTQLITSTQNVLNQKISALTKFIDQQTSYMAFQQNEFNGLARADMLAARREELLRTKELKVALERLMGVALTSRQPPASNDVLALENLTQRIDELETILKET